MNKNMLCSLMMALWYATVPLKGVAFVVLVLRRMERLYPALATLLGTSSIISVYLISVRITQGPDAYGRAWNVPQVIELILYAAVTVEGYLLQSRNAKPSARRAGNAVAVLLSFVALSLVIGTTDLVPARWASAWPILMITRHFTLGCLILLLLSKVLYHSLLVTMSSNVKRHVTILSAFFGALVLGPVSAALEGAWVLWGLCLMFATSSACFLMWIFTMTVPGEAVPLPYELSTEELRREVRVLQQQPFTPFGPGAFLFALGRARNNRRKILTRSLGGVLMSGRGE